MGLHLYDTAQRSAWLVKHADFSQGLKRQTCSGGTDKTMEFPLHDLIIRPSLLKKIGLQLNLLTHIAEGFVTHFATLHGLCPHSSTGSARTR